MLLLHLDNSPTVDVYVYPVPTWDGIVKAMQSYWYILVEGTLNWESS